MLEQLLQRLIDALNANTAALTGVPLAPGQAPVSDAPQPAKKGPGRPPKNPEVLAAAPTQAADVTPQAAPPATVAAPASPPAVSASSAPTFKDAADALIEVCEKVNRDAGVALLKKYGCGRAPELKPADFAAFIADAKAALAPAAAPSSTSGLI